MKSIRIYEFGAPEVMALEKIDALTPGPGQVVVEIKAAGVNPIDTYIRSGNYPINIPLPYTPGFDGAGIIKIVGEGVRHYVPGDRVYITGSVSGTYAEQTLCTNEQIFPLPEEMSFEQGAAIGIPYGTAYRALFTKARAVDKETILIHGATGGVGVAALQLAKAANLNIVATSGSQQGVNLIKEHGIEHILNHNQKEHWDEINAITEGQGVDVILEMLANVNLDEDLKILKTNGRIVVIGCRGPVTINPREAMAKEASILGMLLMNTSAEERIKIYSSLEAGLQSKQLNPILSHQFPLAEASKAHNAILEPGAHGKIVLIP